MKAKIVCAFIAAAALLLGAYCCYEIYSVIENKWFIIAYALFVILFYPVAVLLHECGHIIFGLMVKISAYPVLKFVKPSCCKIIPKTDKNLKFRIIFTALGGVAVNLIFTAFGLVALFVPAVPVQMCFVLPASFYIFALNVIPLYMGDGKTDGLVVYELVKNEDSAAVMLAVLTVHFKLLNGTPIAKIDKNLLFGLPQIREDDESFIALTELRYEYFKATGNAEEAEKHRQRFENLKNEYL